MKILRFLSDPKGYVVESDEARPTGWVTARVGISDVYVLVNADQAYVVEDYRR